MLLRKIRGINGEALTIWAIDLSPDAQHWDCPAVVFIGQLTSAAQKSAMNLIRVYASAGTLPVPGKMRPIREGISELKIHSGHRILFFQAPGHRIILTHGFKKGAKLPTEVARAIELRRQWEEETNA